MTDPIRRELTEDLRAATLGEGAACDYYARPKTIESDDLPVRAFSPATECCRPMEIDQQLMAASEPTDHGLSRWTRVIGMVNAEPPDPLREHIEDLIEHSPEIPEQVKS